MENAKMTEAFLSICTSTYSSSDRLSGVAAVESQIVRGPSVREAAEADRSEVSDIGSSSSSACTSFAAIINAGTCANVNNAATLEGYFTLISQPSCIDSYMY